MRSVIIEQVRVICCTLVIDDYITIVSCTVINCFNTPYVSMKRSSPTRNRIPTWTNRNIRQKYMDCANFHKLVLKHCTTKLSAIMRKQRVFFCSLLGLTTITCIFWRELSIILVITIAPNHVNCYWSGSSDIMKLGQGKWG